ncbi:prolyl oligopeptidase family serine peptidase [Aquibacillus koreensis]|uniref:Prolyl oligopeptidase family serine peptidase n=1 Tax=Aquibacillus koreensis TaxID=279446 RepID=A0A9X4AHL5_9BACI|nr:alpha/beta fold hydrolase [Aquibacillus koreensis]MCT2535629.1 prolyl oligopeptidase family serine peptidase [Aquibacillus koreensis]MDC3420086.1 prolyl oligopeptidase family serine peptidase [Aquibacillus koreensis]
MIGIYKEYWNEIPVLVVVHSEYKDQALPVLTYIHGFTSAKEHNLPLAYLLAEKGYRVVLPDCIFHGERQDNITDAERQLQFFKIVEQNLQDLLTIRTVLMEKNLIKDNRFGLAGTSMGGITTAAALTQYDWIKAAAILMGSPKITQFANELVAGLKDQHTQLPITEDELSAIFKSLEQIDLSKQKKKLDGRPLFFWHGEKDQVVPFNHSYSFYEEVISLYKNPENIRFLREIGRGHKVSRFAITETVNWLEYQL